jgi:hypothetical protein
MRWLALLTLLLVGAVGLLWAADDKKPDDMVKGFAIHEWGVFRVHDDVALANADRRAQWDELPAFVYGQTTTRDFPRHWEQAMNIYKPVLFFHAPRALEVEVRVDFEGGVPAVWWPATWNPAYHDNTVGFGQRTPAAPPKMAKSLEWKLDLQIRGGLVPDGSELKPVSKGHWIQTLRDIKCDDVFVPVGEKFRGVEREKFVYYDGLLTRVQALAIKLEKDKAALKNQEKFAVFDIWIIDNRDAKKPRLGRLPRLDAGRAADVELTAPKVERWTEAAGKTLTAQLKDAGLNEDEAAALTTIWSTDFFQSAGLTLFYRLPQEEYDRLLPLTVKPRPEKVVRVGLIQQIPFDTELAGRVAKLVKQLDDDSFAKREAAQQELAQLGVVDFGYLRRVLPTVTAPEPKRRVEQLLEKHDAERVIRK